MGNRGTAFSLGQHNEVLISLTRALPKALSGMDPADVIARANKNGEELSRRLHDLLATLGKTDAPTEQQEQPALALPDIITLTLGGRTYVSPRESGYNDERKMGVMGGEEDVKWFCDHQKEIPIELCGRVVFVFGKWRLPIDSLRAAIVYWDGNRWIFDWRELDLNFLRDRGRYVRRSA